MVSGFGYSGSLLVSASLTLGLFSSGLASSALRLQDSCRINLRWFSAHRRHSVRAVLFACWRTLVSEDTFETGWNGSVLILLETDNASFREFREG